MDTQQPPPDRRDRPNTLGQAWHRMAEPRPRLRRPPDPHLPILPDWPPLPDEQPSPSAWPSLGPAGPNALHVPGAPDESHPADAFQPTTRDEMLWPGRSWSAAASPAPAPVPTRAGRVSLLSQFRRFDRSSKRARVSLAAAAAVMLVVVIVACSSLALHATAGLVTGDVAPGAHGAANQSSTAHALATVTAHPTSQPTPTSAPPPPLTLAITCASGQIRGTGRVCVHTLPGASLSLTVRYCDGSTAKGLRSSATADTSGNYTWTWPVHLTCAGPATATVTATASGQSLTASDTFTITG